MSNPTYDSFSSHVFEEFEKHIIGKVFKMIEEDRDLQKEYLDLVAQKGRPTVNRWLGRKIKNRYKLQSIKPIEGKPDAIQIQGHTMLKK